MSFDTTQSALVFEKKGKNNTSRVYEDVHGNKRVVNTADVEPVLRASQALKAHNYSPKQHTFFNSKVRDGDRIIARIPIDWFVQNPDMTQDDKAMERWLDHDPLGQQCKAIDVHWTRTTGGKGMVNGIAGKTE